MRWYLTGTESAADSSFGNKKKKTEKGRFSRRAKALIAAGTVIIILGAGAVIGSKILDRNLEADLTAEVETMITDSGLDELVSYDSVTVSSLTGTAALNNLTYNDDYSGVKLSAGKVSMRVPQIEAFKAISALAGVSTKTDGNRTVSKGIPEVHVSWMEYSVEDVVVTLEEGDRFSVGSITLRVDGNLNTALIDNDTSELGKLDYLDSVELSIKDINMKEFESVLNEALGMVRLQAGVTDFLKTNEFHLKLINDTENSKVTLSDLRYSTPLSEESASAEITYFGRFPGNVSPKSISFKLNTSSKGIKDALSIDEPGSGEQFVMDLPPFNIALSGDIGFIDEFYTPDLKHLKSQISVSFGSMSVTVPKSFADELIWEYPFISEAMTGNKITVDNLELDAGFSSGEVLKLNKFAIASPFIKADANGVAELGGEYGITPETMTFSGTIAYLPDYLHGILSGAVMMFGSELPESESFSFSFKLGEDGVPMLNFK